MWDWCAGLIEWMGQAFFYDLGDWVRGTRTGCVVGMCVGLALLAGAVWAVGRLAGWW